MVTPVEHYQQMLKDGIVFDSATFYLHEEESAKNLRTAFEGKYTVRTLERNEVPFWANDMIAVRVNRLETASVGGMGQ